MSIRISSGSSSSRSNSLDIEIVGTDPESPRDDDVKVTQKMLIAIATRIEQAIDEADNDVAIQGAEDLYQLGLAYVRQGEKEIPLQISLKTVHLLTKGEIQYCHFLKERLSAISALFAERVSFLVREKQYGFYPNVRIDLLKDLAFVICCTPEMELATRFEAECCGAAIHEIIPIDERMKGVIIKSALPLFKGAVTSGAALSPAPIVEPLINLIVNLFEEKPKFWYPEISKIRRAFLSVRQLEDLENQEIKGLLLKWKDSHKHAICFVQIFSRILTDPTCSKDLKDRVFEGPDPSLEGFSKYQKELPILGLSRFLNSWDIRYLSVKKLSELMQTPEHREKSVFTLACRLAKERDARVGNFLMELYQQDVKDRAAWNNALAQLAPQEIESEDKELRQNVEKTIQKVREDIEKNDMAINQKRSKLDHSKKHSGGRIGEEEDSKTIAKQIENLSVEAEELKNESEQLEKEVREFDELQTRSLALIKQAQKMLPNVSRPLSD